MTSWSNFEGSTASTYIENQGLGERFFDLMYKNQEKLHQIDAHTGVIETHGAVRAKAIEVAAELISQGVKTTDIIVVCSRQHSEQTVVVLGILMVASIVAPIDPDVSHDECFYCIQKMKPKMVFCDVRVMGQIELVLTELNLSKSCQVVVFGGDANTLSLEKFVKSSQHGDFQATRVTNLKNTVAFIIQSQGTFGTPRMVCVSHQAVMEQIHISKKITTGVERVISYFPASYFVQVILMCACYENVIVRILPGTFNERSACFAACELHVDHLFLSPEHALKICNHPALNDFNLSCVQCILVIGAPLTTMKLSQLRAGLRGMKVIQVYGLTEAGFVAAFTENDYNAALSLPSSVGKALPGVKMKVVKYDTREVLGADAWGELMVKGTGVMVGYLKDPDSTSSTFEKGYIKTGDIGQFDSDGYLYVQGMMSDFITFNDKRFLALDVEEVLLSHPFVKEAALVSDQNEMVACVVKKLDSALTSEKLMAFLVEKIPEEKHPTKIKILDTFPKTAIGKVKRNALREAVFKARIKQSHSLTALD